MVDFDQLKTFLDRDGDNNPVAYGVQFRDAKPHTTLSFVRSDGESVHMYVYVDKDYLPLGMALVHPPTPCVTYQEVATGQPDNEKLALGLYAALCEMAQLARMSQTLSKQDRQKKALEEATRTARGLEAAELAAA